MSESPKQYQTILLSELSRRKQKNPGYSLRSFARDLDILPSRLSAVMRGIYGLSPRAAKELSTKMRIPEKEQAEFVDSVISARANRAEKRTKTLPPVFYHLSCEEIKVIADWYHLAILELPTLESFESTPEWIAEYLGISLTEAAAALERLYQLKLIRYNRNRNFEAATEKVMVPEGLSEDALKKIHTQLIKRAETMIDFAYEDQAFSTHILTVKKTKIDAAKEFIKNFQVEFNERFGRKGSKDAVYCLNVQFFGLENQKETQEESALGVNLKSAP